MQKFNLLYSINSFLAYQINEKYYKGTHYVWCAPKFVCSDNPPSSNPKEILKCFLNDVARHDNHSIKIEQNRLGLLNGVEIKYKSKVIDDRQRTNLIKIINNADIYYFRPLIYIIPYNKIKNKLVGVDSFDKAEYFSEEYKIENLFTNEFDIIDIN